MAAVLELEDTAAATGLALEDVLAAELRLTPTTGVTAKRGIVRSDFGAAVDVSEDEDALGEEEEDEDSIVC
jgi:hypothetical protein